MRVHITPEVGVSSKHWVEEAWVEKLMRKPTDVHLRIMMSMRNHNDRFMSTPTSTARGGRLQNNFLKSVAVLTKMGRRLSRTFQDGIRRCRPHPEEACLLR